MQDLLQQLIEKMGIRDEHLRKLGIEEMIKSRKDVTVESVEQFDDESTPTNFLDQGRKN